MLLDRLKIEAFRGIRNSIEVPLDARVTLLVAANGTAKTSICDSAEWLLTGRVRRLQEGLIATESIRNLYAGTAALRVSAAARWKGKLHEIERTEVGQLSTKVEGGPRRFVQTVKILHELTPDYVGQTARTKNVEEARSEWLRAVRFFNPDGLQLLLDDGDDPERVRSIAFAELLGVGPASKRIEELRGVQRQIDSQKNQIADVTEKIAQLEKQLKAEQALTSEPYLQRADAVLREVAHALQMTLPTTLTRRREAMLALQERVAADRRSMKARQAELTAITQALPSYLALTAVVEGWTQQEPEQRQKWEQKKQEAADLLKRIRVLETTAVEGAQRAGQLHILLGQSQALIAEAQLALTGPDPIGDTTTGDLRSKLLAAQRKVKASETLLQEWNALLQKVPIAGATSSQLTHLEKQRLELVQAVPSTEDRESAERRHKEATEELSRLRSQLKQSSDRWQRWGAEVRAQFSNWTGQSDCPLCGYNHGSTDALFHAIQDVMARQPSANQDVAERLANWEKVAAESQAALDQMNDRRRQLATLDELACQLVVVL